MKDYIEITIDEFTSPAPLTVDINDSVQKIFDLMASEGIRHIPVLENNNPIGIISERDLSMIRMLGNDFNLTAGKIMTRNPFCVNSGSSLEEVAFEMSRRKIGSALVLNDQNQLDGIFTSTDGLNALIEIIRGDLQ